MLVRCAYISSPQRLSITGTTSSSMDPRLTLEPSSHTHFPELSPSYSGQDGLASRSQAVSLLGNVQSKVSEEILNICGSSMHRSHPFPFYGKPFCQRSVRS